MTANPLKAAANSNKSPTDPQECCDWANSRLHPDAVSASLHWVVTGDPKKPIALVPIPAFTASNYSEATGR